MEKAPGISLDTLVKYYQQEIGISYIKSYAKQGYFTREQADKAIAECQRQIQKLKAKSLISRTLTYSKMKYKNC